MRSLLILIQIAAILGCFCQSLISPNHNTYLVQPDKIIAGKPSGIVSNPTWFDLQQSTEYYYDTVRSLTELNRPNIADSHPWISPDGLRLYYADEYYSNRLVMAQRENINSYFDAPELVNIPQTWGVSYWLSSDELQMYFTDYNYIYYTNRDAINEPFGSLQYVELDGYPLPEAFDAVSASNDLAELFITWIENETRYILEYEGIDWLYYVYKRTLVAPEGYALCGGQLSKDDLTYYTAASAENGKWMIYQFTRPSVQDTFDISTFEMVGGINDTNRYNAFPSMSDGLEWVSFNRSSTDWFGLDLYLAHNGILTNVFDPKDPPAFSFAYPNPAKELVQFRYGNNLQRNFILKIFSSSGELLYQINLLQDNGVAGLNISDWKNGLYLYQIIASGVEQDKTQTGKFIVQH